MIIGIGGISTSGKSILAQKIKNHFKNKKVKIYCQDDFVRPDAEIPLIKDHINWESPASIDFNRYYLSLLKSVKNCDILIDEGLFVFLKERFNVLYDKSIYISLPKKEFLKRKKADLRWGKEPDWYVEHIWKSHQKYIGPALARKEAFQLSGENPVDYRSVFEYLES
jgi:uridine kinase